MLFKGVELVCPRCRGDLDEDHAEPVRLHCNTCGSTYPIILDIPDLRVFPDPYIDITTDISKGEQLASHFDEFDFPGLVIYYYGNTQVVPQQHAQRYTRGILGGESRSRTSLKIWEKEQNPQEVNRLRLLEIGCGTAALLKVAASRYGQVVGIDIAFRWLVVAKKRLEEAGLDIPLICACAEALPFRDGDFDRVVAESTVEHVKDQPQVISETRRVLASAGQFWVATPNRLSLGPDPQVGIWAGGYLPEEWIAKLVRRKGGIPPRRQLLSAGELIALLRHGGFEQPDLVLMKIPPEQRRQFGAGMRAIIDLYNTSRQMPILRKMLLRFGPLFYAVSLKGE